MLNSLLSLHSHSLCHHAQNGASWFSVCAAYCHPSSLTAFATLQKMVLDMALVDFWVCWLLGLGATWTHLEWSRQDVKLPCFLCGIGAIHWARNEPAPSHPLQSTASALLHKMAPDVAQVEVSVVESTLFLYLPLESAALSLLVLTSNKSAVQVVLCWDPELPVTLFPSWLLLELWLPVECGQLLGYLVTTIPLHCLHCFPVSVGLQIHLCCWPVLCYFLKSSLCASPCLMLIHHFKPVCSLIWHLAFPTLKQLKGDCI